MLMINLQLLHEVEQGTVDAHSVDRVVALGELPALNISPDSIVDQTLDDFTAKDVVLMQNLAQPLLLLLAAEHLENLRGLVAVSHWTADDDPVGDAGGREMAIEQRLDAPKLLVLRAHLGVKRLEKLLQALTPDCHRDGV